MSAFKGLYIKELKISRALFFAGIIALNVITILSLALREYFNQSEIPAGIFLFVIAIHIFYIPVLLLSSLTTEGHSQLWLHNPNNGAKLVLAKLAAGLTYYLISMVASIFLTKFALNNVTHLEPFTAFEGGMPILFMMGVAITLGTIYLSVWIFFYWTVYHAIKNIPFLRNIRWLFLFVFWITITVVGEFIQSQPFYQKLLEYGAINVDAFDNNVVSVNNFFIEMDLNIISVALGIVLTIVVFLVSVWLLERKVEV